MTAVLYVVATPLGNLDDMSKRAIEILKSVDLILAEDTRESVKLCHRFGIGTRLESYHKFSEKRQLDKYISFLKTGKSVALVSDAGTPAVSDPGKYLVREALREEITVSPVPGPSASSSAFSVAGCLSDEFYFAGFLPAKGAAREKALDRTLLSGVPVIVYESPERIESLLTLLSERNARVVVCRELTKHFEEVFEYKGQPITARGEFTVVIEPAVKQCPAPEEIIEKEILDLGARYHLSAKDMALIITRIYSDLKPNAVKDFLLKQP